MPERPLVFLDSGVGGLSFIGPFFARYGGYPIHYVADTAFFPYGQKETEMLRNHLLTLGVKIWEKWNPCLFVLACNTATLVALSFLRKEIPEMPIVGVVPAIKPAVMDGHHTAILATSITTSHDYTTDLLTKFAGDTKVQLISQPKLVQLIEDVAPRWDDRKILREVEVLAETVKREGIRHLVLGCTHFFHLHSLFSRTLPEITCYDAVQGVIQRMRALLDESTEASVNLYCTSLQEERKWQEIAKVFSAQFHGLL